jgi:hypothetical protein
LYDRGQQVAQGNLCHTPIRVSERLMVGFQVHTVERVSQSKSSNVWL